MNEYRVAFIGTGADPDEPSAEGFAMAYRHAGAYRRIENCELVACADIVRENAEAFAAEQGIDDEHVYEDHRTMLAEAEPDVVSVCTPPTTHADLVADAAKSGVDAVHCEKPMALTWAGARRMAQECWRRDVQLTFNHQRRFGDLFRDAKELLDDGAIGDLKRVTYTWGNFFDNGTHAIDMCNYFNDETPAEWVLAGLDYREEQIYFGAHNENQVFALWEYENGVHGMAATGAGADLVDGDWRLEGTDGTVDVHLREGRLDVRRAGEETETITYEERGDWIARAIADVVASLDEGRPCELRARNALNATEIIFGGFESVRRRGRVEFPLSIDDNPLEAMVESGALSPASTDAE